MSLIVKTVFEITYSVFNHVVHAVMRDLWYHPVDLSSDDADEDGLIPNSIDEGCSAPTQAENESFCTSLSVEESVANVTCLSVGDSVANVACLPVEESITNVCDETCSIEDNSMVQNYEVTIQKDALTQGDNADGLKTSENEAASNVTYDFKEIQRIFRGDNSEEQDDEENFNDLSSPKTENCIWAEIPDSHPKPEETNLNQISLKEPDTPDKELNIPEKELSGNTFAKLTDEIGTIFNPPAENVLSLRMEGESHSPIDDTNLGPDIDREHSLNDNGEKLLTGESEEKQDKSKNIVEPSEDHLIGDSKTSAPEVQTDGKSDISSEYELGIRNFQTNNLIDSNVLLDSKVLLESNILLDSIVEKPAASTPKRKGKKKPLKSRISRYIGNTVPKTKDSKEPEKPDSPPTQVPDSTPSHPDSTEPESKAENVLQPLKYDEITSTQSLLNELQNAIDSGSTVPDKSDIDEDSEISKAPAETSDLGSVCSDDSWDSWLGRFTAIMRSKSPTKNADLLAATSAAEPVAEAECDCVNTHSCLLVVDSEDDATEDLLSAEQLGSVETGSTVHNKTE